MQHDATSVVGIVDSTPALRLASRLKPSSVDWLEWRGDCLPGHQPPESKIPWLLTVRHPAEGGANRLGVAERRAIFSRCLERASAVDLELRSADQLRDVLKTTQACGLTLILSYHNFRTTPSLSALRAIVRCASTAGADIVKIATRTDTPAELARLVALFSGRTPRLAVMGMGRLGSVSRLVLAACGSALTYGWLHKPNVPGQLGALEIRKLLSDFHAQ